LTKRLRHESRTPPKSKHLRRNTKETVVMSKPISVLDEAREYRELVTDVWVRLTEDKYYNGMGSVSGDNKTDLIREINLLAEAEALTPNDVDGIKKIAIQVVKTYTILAGHGCVTNTEELIGAYKRVEGMLEKEREAKKTLKKDNEELVKQLAKAEAKFELVSEQLDKLLSQVVVGYKKSLGP